MKPRRICTLTLSFGLILNDGCWFIFQRSWRSANVCRSGSMVWICIKNGRRTCVTSLTLKLEVVPVARWNWSLKSVIILHIISSRKCCYAFFSRDLMRLLLFIEAVNPALPSTDCLFNFCTSSSSLETCINLGMVFSKVIRFSLFWSRGKILRSISKNWKASKLLILLANGSFSKSSVC